MSWVGYGQYSTGQCQFSNFRFDCVGKMSQLGMEIVRGGEALRIEYAEGEMSYNRLGMRTERRRITHERRSDFRL